MSRTPIPTTPYTVGAVAVFASDRWRFEIHGANNALVIVSASTFDSPETAIRAGVMYGRAMARQVRRDMSR
jgi:hypothetical protein